MRKLKLKVNVPDDGGGTSGLFRAFFEEYSQENVFKIENKKLSLEFSFEELSEKMIDAISAISFSCIEELTIEEVVEEADETGNAPTESETVEVDLKKKEDEEQETAVAEQTSQEVVVEEEKTKSSITSQEEKTEAAHKGEADEIGQKFFEEVAQQSQSFQDFVVKCGEAIKITKGCRRFFEVMLHTAEALNSSDMTKIRKDMEKNGEYTNSQRITCSQRVKKVFETRGSSIRLKTFIECVIQYKDYNFENHAFPTAQKEVISAEKEEFQVIEKKLIDAVSHEETFQGKVKSIFDVMCSKTTCDSAIYIQNRDVFYHILISVAEERESNNLSDVLRERFSALINENSHIAIAFFHQVVKDYCTSVGYTGKNYVEAFFDDLRKLM